MYKLLPTFSKGYKPYPSLFSWGHILIFLNIILSQEQNITIDEEYLPPVFSPYTPYSLSAFLLFSLIIPRIIPLLGRYQ